ncbi:hypothetical protein BHM03_00025668, partial [Ensete ventricosum]
GEEGVERAVPCFEGRSLLLALLYLMAFSSLLPKPCSPFPFSLTNSIAYPRLAPLRISIRSFLTNPISNPLHSRSSPARLSFRAWAEGHRGKPEAPPPLPPSPPPERKSFAVATGELFLGLASLLVRSRGSAFVAVPPDAEVYVDGRGASNGSVVEESVDGDVIWEQMSKDVEAEKERNKVTSPGFSFSAAGLLFPYHLGVAQFLLEKGYIKLGHRRAGAVVCVVIASGKSMQEALIATKILAEDCRLKGTAFRLGAVLREVRVCAFPASRLGMKGTGISPDCNPENRATPRQVFVIT